MDSTTCEYCQCQQCTIIIEGEHVCKSCGVCQGPSLSSESEWYSHSLTKCSFIENICHQFDIPPAVEQKALWIWTYIQSENIVKSINRVHVMLACIAVSSNMDRYPISLSRLVAHQQNIGVTLHRLYKCIRSVCENIHYTWIESVYSTRIFAELRTVSFPSELHRRFLWQCCRKVVERIEDFEIDANPSWVASECVRILFQRFSSPCSESSILPSDVIDFLCNVFQTTLCRYPFRKLNLSYEIQPTKCHESDEEFDSQQV